MALWKIEVYESGEATRPIRTGYANASSEQEAIDLGKHAMGVDLRADLQVIQAASANNLPNGKVLWASEI